MAAIDINRGTTGINMPAEVSNEIWSKTQEASAIMRLATPMELPGNGIEVDMITGDPEASWVGETEEISISKGTASSKKMKGYKMGVIVPFSNEFARDKARLFDEMVARVPAVLANKFDGTCFGKYAKPGDLFDNFSDVTGVDVKKDPWAGFVAADAAIAENNAILNGYGMSPKLKSLLLTAKDGNGRPLFINSISENGVPVILGNPTFQSREFYIPGKKSGSKPEVLGIAGDWTSARYGIVQGLTASVATESTLTISGQPVNLWQRDMFAIKFTFEVGFRFKYAEDFVLLTGEVPNE